MLIELQNIYLEHYSKEELSKLLESSPNVAHWVFILHDKDRNEHGLKKAHYHVGIDYVSSKHENLVYLAKEEFASLYAKQGVSHISTQIRKVKSPVGFLEYLTHANNPEKFQYSKTEIVTNSNEWVEMNLIKKGRKTTMVREFLEFVLEENRNGCCVNDATAMQWFITHDMADFYIVHQYGINAVLKKQFDVIATLKKPESVNRA